MLEVEIIFRSGLTEQIPNVSFDLEELSNELMSDAVFANLKDSEGKFHLIRIEEVMLINIKEIPNE